MTGYNRLNGTYCSEHEWLLAGVLRGERKLPVVVLGAVVEAQDRRHVVMRPRPIERGHRIHPAGAQHDDFHGIRLATKNTKST